MDHSFISARRIFSQPFDHWPKNGEGLGQIQRAAQFLCQLEQGIDLGGGGANRSHHPVERLREGALRRVCPTGRRVFFPICASQVLEFAKAAF